MNLKTALKQIVAESARGRTQEEIEKQSAEIECSEFKKRYPEDEGVDSGVTFIPKFYFKIPKENEKLAIKFREESRSMFLQRRSRDLMDNNELHALWVLLEKHHSPPYYADEQLINYKDFLKVGALAGSKCKPYFNPKVFAKLLQGDAHGRVSIMSLFNYVMRKVWLHQTRIGLSLYDQTGQGFLREADLENYIQELIPTLPQLKGLEESFHNFYVCTAVRKFLFFLDPLRTGKVRIQDILACSFLDDLLELRDVELPKDAQVNNWFSAPSVLRVYGQYLNLDKDRNGMLSKEELVGYGTGTLTHAFLDRVFQECLTYEGEMDYKTYLDLVLALENRQEPQSLQFLFRILDINNRGYLDTFCFNYFFSKFFGEGTENLILFFKILDLAGLHKENKEKRRDKLLYYPVVRLFPYVFVGESFDRSWKEQVHLQHFRAIQEQMSAHGQDPVSFDDIKDEIFDMVKPEDPFRITLKDLLQCGQGDTVVSILIDLNGFWTYENREAMASEVVDEGAEAH